MRTERYSAVEEDEEPEFTAAAGEALEVVIGRPESGDDSEEGIRQIATTGHYLDHHFEST